MRGALTCAALAATLSLGVAHPALSQAVYKLALQHRAEKYGQYMPVALTDSGLAAGTIYYSGGGSSAYFSDGKFFSDDAFCAGLGATGGTTLTGISRDPAVTYTVGNCSSALPYFGYIYNQTANTTTAVQYPGAQETQVNGVSLNGKIVGQWNVNQGWHGFYATGGTYVSFDVPSASSTYPQGISSQNTIFGDYADDASGIMHGFLLNTAGSYTTITYPGATSTIITGLNGQNLASGIYVTGNADHAFVWQNGTFSEPPLPQHVYADANAVNESGDVAGDFTTNSASEGFVWQPASNTLITFKGAKTSTGLNVTAVNNTHAQVAGEYYNKGGSFGFIATCTGAGCL
jgi:hypothetical protein